MVNKDFNKRFVIFWKGIFEERIRIEDSKRRSREAEKEKRTTKGKSQTKRPKRME